MRQLLILALCVIAAMAAKNCSSVPEPSSTANYYLPPQTCIESDAAIKGCVDAYDACLKIATDCNGVNTCFGLKVFCLVQTTPAGNHSSCTNWFQGLDNAGLYLMAGGSYKDSTLERACEFGLCKAAKDGFSQGVKTANGDVCPVDFATVCTQPNFDPPTRAPDQVQYAVTFGGEAWADVLSKIGNDKKSAAYKEFEGAVAKGLAQLLGVLPHYITITDISIGSLIVKFIITAPNVDVATVTAKLEEAKSNPAIAAAAFTELAAVANIPITVTGVAAEQPTPVPGTPGTPAPNATTPEPTPASAGLVSVAAAVVAVIAMMF